MRVNSHFVGKAGEYSVAAQLLLRGIPVHFPAVDMGVDLIVGSTVRVQVKSSRQRTGRASGYIFTLSSSTPREGHKQYHRKLRDWSSVVDFVVFWGVDENRFWVTPSGVLSKFRKVQTLVLGGPKCVDHTKIREMFISGVSQAAIARAMGVSPMCVSESVRFNTHLNPTPSAEIHKYEGAWNEIESAITLGGLVNHACSTDVKV